MYNNIAKMMLEQYKDKIVVEESLQDYLKSFTKDELIIKLGICCGCDNYKSLGEILLLQTKKKEEIVRYIIKNIDSLYVGLFHYVDARFFNFFKNLINNNGYMKICLDDFKWSISFIMFIRRVGIAKICYISKSREVEVYIPKEILLSIKSLVNNRGIIKKNQKNSDIIYNVECMIDTYGLIDFDSLYNIYNEVFSKIDKEVLLSIISSYSLFSEGINIFDGDNLKLICGVNFVDEDDAFSYYYSTEGDYKVFTKDEYYAISDKSYILKIDDYYELMDFLSETFEMDEDDLNSFVKIILVDYLYSCMEDDRVSKSNLMSKLDDMFEGIIINDKVKIGKLCKNIYLNYPNWGQKGYSIVEKENCVKINN